MTLEKDFAHNYLLSKCSYLDDIYHHGVIRFQIIFIIMLLSCEEKHVENTVARICTFNSA